MTESTAHPSRSDRRPGPLAALAEVARLVRDVPGEFLLGVKARAEVEALQGAVRSLAGWVRELDPHPSLDPCEYLTDEREMAAVRRAIGGRR